MKIMHWIGIDDHADKWTIAQFQLAVTQQAPRALQPSVVNDTAVRK